MNMLCNPEGKPLPYHKMSPEMMKLLLGWMGRPEDEPPSTVLRPAEEVCPEELMKALADI